MPAAPGADTAAVSGSYRVVVFTPLLDDDGNLPWAVEDFAVEKFVARFAVEGLAITVLPRSPGLGVQKPHCRPCFSENAAVQIRRFFCSVEGAASLPEKRVAALGRRLDAYGVDLLSEAKLLSGPEKRR